MKNPLEKFILKNRINEEMAMNALQNAGIISDHCIAAADVAKHDWLSAIDYLKSVVRELRK